MVEQQQYVVEEEDQSLEVCVILTGMLQRSLQILVIARDGSAGMYLAIMVLVCLSRLSVCRSDV